MIGFQYSNEFSDVSKGGSKVRGALGSFTTSPFGSLLWKKGAFLRLAVEFETLFFLFLLIVVGSLVSGEVLRLRFFRLALEDNRDCFVTFLFGKWRSSSRWSISSEKLSSSSTSLLSKLPTSSLSEQRSICSGGDEEDEVVSEGDATRT